MMRKHCKEQKLFHMDVSPSIMIAKVSPKEPSEDEETKKTSLFSDIVEPTTSPNESIISLHSLSGISTPQTLKIKGYIKYHQFGSARRHWKHP